MKSRKSQIERFGPTRRGGPVFRWLGEELAIDLANTVMVVREGEEVDLLATPDHLRRWLAAERERLGDCAFALAHLEEVRALRDAVRGVLLAAAERAMPAPGALRQLNAASAAAPMAPQLEARSDGELRVDEQPALGDPLARLLGTLARSAITLLTGRERVRLHICDAPSCGMLFLGQRRWCCSACGNRARAARHYRRTRKRATARAPRALPG
jgi:predicted RNA-binding Zn ribbon-like protein